MQVPGPMQELLNLPFVGPWNLCLPYTTQMTCRHTVNTLSQVRLSSVETLARVPAAWREAGEILSDHPLT